MIHFYAKELWILFNTWRYRNISKINSSLSLNNPKKYKFRNEIIYDNISIKRAYSLIILQEQLIILKVYLYTYKIY